MISSRCPQHVNQAHDRWPRPRRELPGISMWYDECGQGDPCVLLHPGGAGVDSRALAPTVDALSHIFHAYTPEQRAHGHTPNMHGPVSVRADPPGRKPGIKSVV